MVCNKDGKTLVFIAHLWIVWHFSVSKQLLTLLNGSSSLLCLSALSLTQSSDRLLNTGTNLSLIVEHLIKEKRSDSNKINKQLGWYVWSCYFFSSLKPSKELIVWIVFELSAVHSVSSFGFVFLLVLLSVYVLGFRLRYKDSSEIGLD